MTAAERLAEIRARIDRAAAEHGRAPESVRLIGVTKTFGAEDVRPLIAAGLRDFGENRVQEAAGKWPALRAGAPGITLHLIGPLQSNKAAEAVALFDAIHSVDREKIAAALAKEIARQGRKIILFVQVNTGEEPQKAGVPPQETAAFVTRCRDVHGLAIAGLMAIPPAGDSPGPHFALLARLARQLGLPRLSMGMSSDYETAIAFGATDVRVGSALMGERPVLEKAGNLASG
ncbi:MAG: YggS family pyridoxal phosphate-dependent enzyme [Bauldia sp.]